MSWSVPLLRARVALAAAVAAILCVLADGIEYPWDAGPPMDAALDGDLDRLASSPPLMGAFSLLVRLPFAGVARVLGGGELAEYRAGAFACCLVFIGVVVWISELARRRGAPRMVVLLIPVVAVANPITIGALNYGHPEEMLAAALCVAAAALVHDGRVVLGAVVLGLAVATKQWALAAALPIVVLAPPGRRMQAFLIPAALAIGLSLPFAIGSPDRFMQIMRDAADTRGLLYADSVWLPFAYLDEHAVVDRVDGMPILGEEWQVPRWVDRISHPLIVLISIPLALLFVARWRRVTPSLAVAFRLLALALLLRCVLDPWNNGYYHVPLLLALAAADASAERPAVPWTSIWALGGLTLVALEAPRIVPLDEPFLQENVFYLAWAIPLAAALVRTTLLARPKPLVVPRAAVTAEPLRPAESTAGAY